jgi:O-antigen ligase
MRLRNETMFFNSWAPFSRLAFGVGVGGVVVGTAAGWLAGAQPLYLTMALVAVIVLVYFFADFERAILGLLILRSSLDIFTQQQIPAAFAIGIDALTLLYVTVLLLKGRTVRTDWFWWFFAGWVMLQGMWPILCALGGLGLGPATLPDNIREWTRLFSWLMVYLLVMQLKDRLHPEKIISLLFISLIPPVTLGLMQQFLNHHLPPPFAAGGERINGTFVHPNNLVLFLLLFIALTWWKLSWAGKRWPWVLLLGLLAYIYVGTHAIFGLAMLGTFLLVSILPKLKLSTAIGGVIVLVGFVGLFASTDFGRDRLGMLADTPLFNPNIDVSRAMLLSHSDSNSFNWRLAHWNFLLQSWQRSPLLGYGLSTSIYLAEWHPHNDYIRALLEGGVMGIVTFLAFLGAQGVRLVQLIRHTPHVVSAQRDLCWMLLAVLLATAVGMLTDNVWSGTAFYFYWWAVFGVAGWNWKELQPCKTMYL